MQTCQRLHIVGDILSRYSNVSEALQALLEYPFLLADLLQALNTKKFGVGVTDEIIDDLGPEGATAFKDSVYDTIETRLPAIASREARLLADWFAVLLARVALRHQEQRERALRQSERRFRLAIDRSNVATFEFDVEGRITWVYNSKVPALAGVDLVGRRINEFMSPEQSAALDAAERHALETGARINMHVSLYVAGEQFHRLFGIEVLRDEKGHAIGFSGSSIDTTELRRAEAELSRAVAFREQLIGILGHDLRNPVSAVRGVASLLQLDRSLPPKVCDGLQVIDNAAQRMSEMIETLLDFTRIRFHGVLPVSPSEMDFCELCRSVVEEARVVHSGREVVLDAPAKVRGRWDYPRMAQAVSNLLSNALVHGDDKAPVRMFVGVGPEIVRLDVVNRGPTISPAQIPTLFEPFKQGDAAGTESRPRGLGLGLYIANQIVASHGGSLTAESMDGLTCFTVILNRRR